MNRRDVLTGTAAVLAGGRAFSSAESPVGSSGAYDISVSVEPGAEPDEFVCSTSLGPTESGKVHQTKGVFRRGSARTMRVGEGRPDGTSIDLTVDVSVHASGRSVEFVATVSDRGRVQTTQRTSVSLAKS